MGDDAEDILPSLHLSEDHVKVYQQVYEAVCGYFVKKHNVMVEREKFNRRIQMVSRVLYNRQVLCQVEL